MNAAFFLFQSECSFVSLRDVERAMKVITWFHSNSELIARVIKEEVDVTGESSEDESDEDMEKNSKNEEQVIRIINFLHY